MALIPWKIPEEAPCQHTKPNTSEIDELVQLYISEGKSFSYSEKKDNRPLQKQWMSVLQSHHRGKKCDFVVWMIDPRMDNVLEFLLEGLKVLFPATGNVDCEDRTGANDRRRNAKHRPLVQHLCILINFRDVQSAQKEDSKESIVDQMQQIIEQVLDNHTNEDDATPVPTVLVYESSMKNCYGLQHLHSFITLPYLSHKERELIRRIEHARKQQLQCKQGLKESKVIQYDDFVKHIIVEKNQQIQYTKPLSDRQKLKEEKKRLQLRVKQQNEVLQSREKHDDGSISSAMTAPSDVHLSKESRVASTQSSDRNIQRHVLPMSRKSVPTTAITEQTNLESFFSDDEEDDDQSQSDTDSSCDSSDNSSDDDDDFIVDVSGTRVSHVNTSQRKKLEFAKQKDTLKKKTRTDRIKTKDEDASDTAKTDGYIDDIQSEDSESCPSQNEDTVRELGDIEEGNTKPEIEDGEYVLEEDEVKGVNSADMDTTDSKDDIKQQEITSEIDDEVEETKSKEVNIDNATRDNTEYSDCDDSAKKDDTSMEVDTADTAASSDKDPEDTPSEVEIENRRQMIIDSDDEESTGMIEPPVVANGESKNEPPASLKQPEISSTTPSKTTQVSSAALAAIEVARKEAELMMASPTTKKSKSKKKKKSKKKDKKKD